MFVKKEGVGRVSTGGVPNGEGILLVVHVYVARMIIENGGHVFMGEFVLRISDQQTCFANHAVSNGCYFQGTQIIRHDL